MFRNMFGSLWSEPRPPNAPKRVWRDWLLLAVLLPTALLEGALRPNVDWRPVALILAIGIVVSLLFRRTHPLGMVAMAFGAFIVLDAVAIFDSNKSIGLDMTVCVLLLPYALLRWGSGREVILGCAVMLPAVVLGIINDYTTAGEAFLGVGFFLIPLALGGAVRYRAAADLREKDQAKMHERAQLARELHDTVAHHVSAIAIRAQAGQIVASNDPGAALDALRVIEVEASRALSEMRLMVTVLREGQEADLAPRPGLADLNRLAASISVPVEISLSGDLGDLPPAVESALYRITQESLTNAGRHARQASRVTVSVDGDSDSVRVTITDDGERQPSSRGWTGYGLIGMTERATLLGGALVAGPSEGRGWMVKAILPKAILPKAGSTR